MENKKGIYKMKIDVRRMGTLEGVFVAGSNDVSMLIKDGIEVYFGEVLGKHSEIYGAIEEHEITLISDDDQAVKVFEDLKLATGYNPFHYTTINFSNESIGNVYDLTVIEVIEKLRALQ